MGVDITRLTEHLPRAQQEEVKKAYHKRAKNPTEAFLWCFFLGGVGAHRLYLNQWGAALAHVALAAVTALAAIGAALTDGAARTALIVALLVLLLLMLVWWIVDLARIDGEVERRNLRLAEGLAAEALLDAPGIETQALEQLDALIHDAPMGRMPDIPDAPAIAPTESAPSAEPAEHNAAVAPAALAGAAALAASAPAPAHVESSPVEASPVETQSAEAAPQASEPELAPLPPVAPEQLVAQAPGPADLIPAAGLAAAGVLAAEALTEPTTEESEATTWPDHAPVEATSEVAPTPAAPLAFDATDRGFAGESAPPVADIEPSFTPLVVTLPDETAPDAYLVGGASDEATLLLVPESLEAAAATPPAEAFTPPIVPVLTTSEDGETGAVEATPTEPERFIPPAFAATPTAEEFIPPEFVPPAHDEAEDVLLVPAAEVAPVEAAPVEAAPAEQPAPTGGDLSAFAEPATLAAAAGFAVAAAAFATPPREAPAPSETPTSYVDAAPVAAAQPVAQGAPPAEPASAADVAAPLAGGAAAATELPRHRLKRIRVTRQIKVEGKVIGETSAEEFIELDQDPAPVIERLRQQLHADGHEA